MQTGQSEDRCASPSLKTASPVPANELTRRTDLVRNSTLFAGMSVAECREIVALAHEKQFARRQVMFLDGDPVRHIILLISGSAKLLKFGQNGTEVIVQLKGPGDVVGTTALFPQVQHCATAQTLRASTAIAWDVSVFESLSLRSVHLRRNITFMLGQQLQELEMRFCEISTEKVAARLSHQLIRMRDQVGRRVNGSVEINLSREELAQLTGTTLFTVSRLLSDWNRSGVVSTGREAVSVHNFQALTQLAECD